MASTCRKLEVLRLGRRNSLCRPSDYNTRGIRAQPKLELSFPGLMRMWNRPGENIAARLDNAARRLVVLMRRGQNARQTKPVRNWKELCESLHRVAAAALPGR